MIAILAATLLAYSFPADRPLTYDVRVGFNGYMPLFGGKQADVTLTMQVAVVGAPKDADGNLQVTSEIKVFHLYLKAQEFPLTVQQIQGFFPKTTISLSPEGKVLKNDAPSRRLPVRLPGLDAKRFPDITYLPIEFPAEGVEKDKPFTFKKRFGDSEVEYTVVPKEISEQSVLFRIRVHQSYTVFEDKFGNPVEEGQAAIKVPTTVEGTGSAEFDQKQGIVSMLDMEATATGTATDIKSGVASNRILKTTLQVSAKANP